MAHRLIESGILEMDSTRIHAVLELIHIQSLTAIAHELLCDLPPRTRRRLMMDAFAERERLGENAELVFGCQSHVSPFFLDDNDTEQANMCDSCSENQLAGVTRYHHVGAFLIARNACNGETNAIHTLLSAVRQEDAWYFAGSVAALLCRWARSITSIDNEPEETIHAIVTIASRGLLDKSIGVRARLSLRECALKVLRQTTGIPVRFFMTAMDAFLHATVSDTSQHMADFIQLVTHFVQDANSVAMLRQWTHLTRQELSHRLHQIIAPWEGCMIARSPLLTAAQTYFPEFLRVHESVSLVQTPIPGPLLVDPGCPWLQTYNDRLTRLIHNREHPASVCRLLGWLYTPAMRPVPSDSQILEWQREVEQVERRIGMSLNAVPLGTFYRKWSRAGGRRWGPQDWIMFINDMKEPCFSTPENVPIVTWSIVARSGQMPRGSKHILSSFMQLRTFVLQNRDYICSAQRKQLIKSIRKILACMRILCQWQWKSWQTRTWIISVIPIDLVCQTLWLNPETSPLVFEEAQWTMGAFDLPTWVLDAAQIEALLVSCK